MKKLILILSFLSVIYGNEQDAKQSFDITTDWVYQGCRDELASERTYENRYVLGLAVAKKDVTIDLMDSMSMTSVNGVNVAKVCKWYFNAVNDVEYSSKYIKSANDSKLTFLMIVERNVVEDNGEKYETFTSNLKKIKKLFKK